jgi:predicted  nucleic acid-binding Zn-ribbon protein
MKEQLALLWELQSLEQRKRMVQARKQELNSEDVRRLWQEIRVQTQNEAAEKERLSSLQQNCSLQEKEIDELTTKLKALERRLYGGELCHAKEIEQIKDKYEAVKREIGSKETCLLESMEQCEGISAVIRKAEQAILVKKREHQAKQQEVTAKSQEIDAELQKLESLHSELYTRIDHELMPIYQKLQRKLPTPVAKLEHGICGGCRMNLPTNQQSLSNMSLVYCDNCGRILMI